MHHRYIKFLLICMIMLITLPVVHAAPSSWRALSDTLVSRATPHIESRDYARAIDFLEQALVANPKNARAFILRGRIALAQKDDAFAISALDTGLALNPDNRAAHLSLGRAYLRLDNLQAATRQLEQLRALCRNCREAKLLATAIEQANESPDKKTTTQ